MRPLSVLRWHYCVNEPGKNGGGAESGLRDEARGLREAGHEVAWLWSGQIERAVAEFKPDVVHIGTIHCVIPPEVAEKALGLGVPVVWHLHDYWPFCGPRMLLVNEDQSCPAVEGVCTGCQPQDPRWLELVNRCAGVVVGNRYSAEIMRRNGVHVSHVVESGIDTEAFRPSGESLPDTVCAMNAWGDRGGVKGLDVARRAVTGEPWQINLITGLARESVPEVLRRFGIFVNTSQYQETFCLAVTEAMASGLAVVVSDVAGPKAQVVDGETGLLYPRGDAIALRECVRRLRTDGSLRERLGNAARAHVAEDHTLAAMAARWVAVYEEVTR